MDFRLSTILSFKFRRAKRFLENSSRFLKGDPLCSVNKRSHYLEAKLESRKFGDFVHAKFSFYPKKRELLSKF